MHKKTIRWISLILFAWFVVAALGPCTITHKFGPYYGKVTDENGVPLEGAIVLSAYFTEMYTPGGPTTHFVEAQEAFTNASGEFTIPAYRAWAFRFPHAWNPTSDITIFKPGHQVFPMHTIAHSQYAHIVLKKLTTREERINNLHGIFPGCVPKEKLISLMQLRDIERNDLNIK